MLFNTELHTCEMYSQLDHFETALTRPQVSYKHFYYKFTHSIK